MSTYLAPGVYIEEIEVGPVPIDGVSTNTAAILGETERGPTMPVLLTSYNDYLRKFGSSFGDDQYVPSAVYAFFQNGGSRCYLARIVDRTNSTAASQDFGGYHVEAIGPGDWGKRIFVQISDSTTTTTVAGQKTPIGIKIEVAYWAATPTPPNPLPNPFAVPGSTAPRLAVPPQMTEVFDDVVLDDPSSQNYYQKRLPGNSGLIVFSQIAGSVAPVTKGLGPLTQGGAAGNAPTVADYAGVDPVPTNRQGLAALLLDPYRDIALVHAPNAPDPVTKLIISHCEDNRFRFAVVDCPVNVGDVSQLDPRTTLQDTTFAAFYSPWVAISDPKSGMQRKVPPGGSILGIYSRSDSNRGVFKAPANEPVFGALDLEFKFGQAEQESLNPNGVNAIRQFPGRGILVWGARTLSSNALWKYVSVRRLLIFLEHSIFDGTQWVVFEPNDEKLWGRVADSIRLFLRTQWREGALMGTTEDEAFTIVCDRTTMTQDDILNGRLICQIGVAPVRPAEFVIFQIYQMTQEAQS